MPPLRATSRREPGAGQTSAEGHKTTKLTARAPLESAMVAAPSGGIGSAAVANEETMSALVIRIALAAVSVGLQAVVALADGPPKLNVSPSCDAAARGAIVAGRDKEACMGDERTAQDTLKQNWSKYSGADKTQCVGNVLTGGPASYVELLSCLEIMRDSKAIRESDPLVSPDPATPHQATRRAHRRHR
jgi:hypothetical protein